MVKEYKKVYFRIEAGYEWNSGISEKKREILNKEIRKIFLPLGFEIKAPTMSAACEEAVKEKNRLYLHPMHFSGEIELDNIELIKQAIENSNIPLRAVDVYETIYDADEQWLMSKLNEQRNDYKEKYFEKFKTTRRNKFVALSWGVHSPIKLIGTGLADKVYRDFLNSVIDDLHSEGLLIKMSNEPENRYFRSLNSTEYKRWQAVNKKKEKHLA